MFQFYISEYYYYCFILYSILFFSLKTYQEYLKEQQEVQLNQNPQNKKDKVIKQYLENLLITMKVFLSYLKRLLPQERIISYYDDSTTNADESEQTISKYKFELPHYRTKYDHLYFIDDFSDDPSDEYYYYEEEQESQENSNQKEK